MVRTAAPSPTQVFVDSTGRRKRLVGVIGVLVALFATAYMAVVGASVVQASDSGLSTKATVSTPTSASPSTRAG